MLTALRLDINEFKLWNKGKKSNLRTSSWALRTKMGIFHRLLTKSVILSPRGTSKAQWGDKYRICKICNKKTLAPTKSEDDNNLNPGDTVVPVLPVSASNSLTKTSM